MPPMIDLSRVSVTYKAGDVNALRDITLCVPQGDFVFLVGTTGSGKSTLLKLLYRDALPTAGTLSIAGRDITNLPAREIPALRRQMGIVLQDYGLLPQRTVWENVAFAGQVLGQGRRELRKRLPEVLDLVGMMHRCDAFPGQLSGGEQQRVAIARALVNHPPLLIADEPTGNLDPDTSMGIMQVLLEANRRGATVVVATHDHLAVDRLKKRVVAIERGVIVRDDEQGCYDPSLVEQALASVPALTPGPSPNSGRGESRGSIAALESVSPLANSDSPLPELGEGPGVRAGEGPE